MTRVLVRVLSGIAAVWCATISCGDKLVVGGGEADGGNVDGGLSDAAVKGPWMGNEPDCPSSPPLDLEACQVAEGQYCAYWWKDEYGQNAWRMCGCWEASSATRLWSCKGGNSATACPTTKPTPGSTCDGSVGANCRYPERTNCDCHLKDAVGAVWDCWDEAGQPIPPPRASVDPSKSILNLTDAERQAWCEWYVQAVVPQGSGEPPPQPIDGAGFVGGSIYLFGPNFYCAGCIPAVPVAYCMDNLRLSSCDAPISELTDCVATIVDACFPATHGCARYLEGSGCSGTMVVSYDPAGGAAGASSVCSIKVQ